MPGDPLRTPTGAVKDTVSAELALVWRQMPVIVFASVVAMPIVAAVAAGSQPVTTLVLLVAAHWGLAGWRLYQWHRYRSTRDRPGSGDHRAQLLWGVGSSGLLWMIVGFWLVPSLNVFEMYFAAAVVTGMCAGAATSLANHPPALLLYLGPTVGGLAAGLVLSEVIYSNWFALLLVVYIGGLWFISLSTHRTLVESIAMRQARDQLAGDLSRTTERLQQVIDRIPVGVLLFGPDERLILSNAAVTTMLPIEAGHLQPGMLLADMVRMTARDTPNLPLDAERWTKVRTGEFRDPGRPREFTGPAGRWVRVYNIRLPNGDMLATYVDITSLKDREVALEKVAEAAQSANEAKSDFLALMSHELRTPLNSILGFAELLQAAPQADLPPERMAEYAGDIAASGRLLLQIINDILDLSKIEAGHRRLEEERIDLARVIASALRLIDASARQQNLMLDTDLPIPCPTLWADQKAVAQILINLLGNAVKFSRVGGRIIVRVRVAEDGLQLRVEDTGIGIPPEDLERVLEPFTQSESSYARRQTGTGLGLTIVKSLADLQNARFDLTSTVGVGTVATVTFPADRVRDVAPTFTGGGRSADGSG